jgi:thymidylate synthase (FAD)
MNLIRLGWTPEKARVVLPLDTNTELVHTAFVEDWKHFLDLRCHGKTGKPHPDAQKIAEKLYQKLKTLKYIK